MKLIDETEFKKLLGNLKIEETILVDLLLTLLLDCLNLEIKLAL